MCVLTDFLKSCKHYINFIFITEYASLSVNDARKWLIKIIKLYPGGFAEYTYRQFKNSQEFALDGGVIFDTSANKNESHAEEVFISAL